LAFPRTLEPLVFHRRQGAGPRRRWTWRYRRRRGASGIAPSSPPTCRCGCSCATTGAAATPGLCAWPPRLWRRWPPGLSTTRWAVGSIAIPPTSAGWFRTSKRCSTTPVAYAEAFQVTAHPWARAMRCSLSDVVEQWQMPLLAAKSTNGAFIVDWRQPTATDEVIRQLAETVVKAVTIIRRSVESVLPKLAQATAAQAPSPAARHQRRPDDRRTRALGNRGTGRGRSPGQHHRPRGAPWTQEQEPGIQRLQGASPRRRGQRAPGVPCCDHWQYARRGPGAPSGQTPRTCARTSSGSLAIPHTEAHAFAMLFRKPVVSSCSHRHRRSTAKTALSASATSSSICEGER
jgi:hypothetical protein